jgi:chaperonin GroES
MDLNQSIDNLNVAGELDEDLLSKLGQKVVKDFEEDEDSRSDWLERAEDWIKLATQVTQQKSYPWANASNVKFPLLATAAMQFAARAYPSLVPGPNMITGVVKGRDMDGQQDQRAKRIGRHMSYQIQYEMPDWEEEMDKLCLILPIVGCAFKKTYYDPLNERNVSELVMAQDLAINYWAKSLESASRKTHIIYRNDNEIVERINAGIYLDVDLQEPVPYNSFNRVVSETSGTREPSEDDDTPYTLLEQHTWYDLDGDGYKEPWIITVEHASKKVLRIVPRFDEKGITRNGDKIVRIVPVEYFTKFPFIPNPDGGIYDLGFGLLLGGINNSINTLINQLIDAGTLNNLQSGFIGRGIRIRGGNLRFQPGEWKQADFTGEDISKNIFPLPTKEPSNVLLELFGLLNSSGEKLASIMEIATGKLPGQNTPATTTMASVEQSLKIFTAIYKRLYRALTKEYEKLYRLNSLNLDSDVYFTLNMDPSNPGVTEQTGQMDYSEDIIVKPNADPNVVSEAQELGRAQGLLELVQLGTVNVQAATKRILEAQKQVNIAELMTPNPPQPNPQEQEMQMKQQEMAMKMQMEQEKAALKSKEAEFKMMMEAQKGKMDLAMKQMELQLKEAEQSMKLKHAQMEHVMKLGQSQQQMEMTDIQNAQKVGHSQATHEQDMKMAKQKGDIDARNASNKGNVGGVEKKSSD